MYHLPDPQSLWNQKRGILSKLHAGRLYQGHLSTFYVELHVHAAIYRCGQGDCYPMQRRCGKPLWRGCAEAAGKKVIRLSLTCLCGLTANREGLLARPFFDFYQSLNSSDRQQYQLATLAYGRQGIAIR